MVPMEGKHCWMLAVEIAILFHGMLLKNAVCESSATDETCRKKNVMFVSKKPSDNTFSFPTQPVYRNESGTKFFFNIYPNNSGECESDFNCGYKVFDIPSMDKVYLILNKTTLSKQDIVLMREPLQEYKCWPSELYGNKTGFLVNIHFCLDKVVQNIRFTQEALSGEGDACDENACKELAQTNYECITANGKGCLSCERPVCNSTTTPTPVSISTTPGTTAISATTETTATSATTETTATSATTKTTTTTTTPETTATSTTTETTTTSATTETTATSTTTETTTTSATTETTATSTITKTTTTTTTPETTVASTTPGTTVNTTGPGTTNSLETAVDIMNNLSSMLGDLNITHITEGDIKGVITRLPLHNHTDINVAIKSGELTILKETIDLSQRFSHFSQSVNIKKDASAMAVKKNSSSAGVLLVPGVYPTKDDPDSLFAGSVAVGIEMGAEISGLSPAVDIHFRNVEKNGKSASCRSWDGKGKGQKWITDGCQTNETSEGITCHCSHLTFFAILLSPPAKNISASDFKSLTYITSVGCGLSMFFLAVGLFMHFLIRKGKANRATVILMNLFVAMFNLNLSFLVNEHIANLGNFGACVTIAAVMHYTMLATFSWFFIQALHLYINLRTLHTDIKHYTAKICIAGWVTPAAVVIGLLAAGKYDYLFIYTSDGNSAKMCWISDAVVHQGVNIGYYAIVFIFTFTIFIMTVGHIVGSKPAAKEKAGNVSSIKTNSFSILGLFFLLGITWAFAFFSHGPMLIPSYYIFTILNSFQGFFLFIYYYNSSKIVQGAGGVSSSSITTSTVACQQ